MRIGQSQKFNGKTSAEQFKIDPKLQKVYQQKGAWNFKSQNMQKKIKPLKLKT